MHTLKRLTGHNRLINLAILLMTTMLLGIRLVSAAPFAYVSYINGNTVTVIDTATNTVVSTIPLGGSPLFMNDVAFSPDGNLAYISGRDTANGKAQMTVIDTATNTVATQFPISTDELLAPGDVAVTPDGKSLYVPVLGLTVGPMVVFDTTTNAVVATIPTVVTTGPPISSSSSVVISPDGTRAYASGGRSVFVIDTATNTVVNTIPAGFKLQQIVISPNGQRVYVVDNDSRDVAVIDTVTNAVMSRLQPRNTATVFGRVFSVGVSPDGSRAYVGGNGYIAVFDTSTNAEVAALTGVDSVFIGEGAFTDVAFTPTGDRAYFVDRGFGNNRVLVLDTATNTVIDSPIPVGSLPESVPSKIAIAPSPATSVAFGNFIAKLEVERNAFELSLAFSLGSASNGIAPLTEAVTLNVGGFSTTIPAGSFKKNRDGVFKFEGKINGIKLEARIKPLGGNRFLSKAEAKNADVSIILNPVPVTLTIGNDSGKTSVKSRF